MKYGMLLWPHANARYQQAVMPLALGEMELLLKTAGISAQPVCERIAQTDWITFESQELSPRHLSIIGRHGAMYLLCQMENDLMRPVNGANDPYLGRDLSGILKYKGKTNEAFTRSLINYALCSSDFALEEGPLSLLDPMCGRGTALFEGLNKGYHVWGGDISKTDLDEGARFLKKYLEYHRIKHKQKEGSLTLPGGKSAPVKTLEFAPDKEAFDEGDTRRASFVCQDAALALRALPQGSFHLAVCDLPYGIQHGPGGRDNFDQLLKKVLPCVHRALKKGGAVALSFNTHTLPAQKVLLALEEAGFTPCRDAAYQGLEHWVEQAIVRDLAVGVK